MQLESLFTVFGKDKSLQTLVKAMNDELELEYHAVIKVPSDKCALHPGAFLYQMGVLTQDLESEKLLLPTHELKVTFYRVYLKWLNITITS